MPNEVQAETSPQTLAARDVHRPSCRGTTKAGNRCRKQPAQDSLWCHQHEPIAPEGPTLFDLKARFSVVPDVLRNLLRDLELRGEDLDWLREQIGSRTATEQSVKVRLILENLSLRCEECGVGFTLLCSPQLGELRILTGVESWDLENRDGCPLCGSPRLEIDLDVNPTLESSGLGTFVLAAGFLVMLLSLGAIWWGPLASLPLLAQLLVTAVALLLEFVVTGLLMEWQQRKRLRRPAPDAEKADGTETLFSGLAPSDRDRGQLSLYRGPLPDPDPEPTARPSAAVGSSSLTCDRCGRSVSSAEAVRIPGYVVCPQCDRALEQEILQDAGAFLRLR